jgi:flagellar secretion chaperone FliS
MASQLKTISAEAILGRYDDLVKLLSEAEVAFRYHPPAWTDTYCRRLVSAQGILTDLIASLDLDRGGSTAANLFRIYDYMDFHIAQATLSYDPSAIVEVKQLLKDLKSGLTRD